MRDHSSLIEVKVRLDRDNYRPVVRGPLIRAAGL
jgi:hypothetical protein